MLKLIQIYHQVISMAEQANVEMRIKKALELKQSLESKLEEIMNHVDNKDTAQLTKKVGGMDRQIAKLNKSIEKIASHVVEK